MNKNDKVIQNEVGRDVEMKRKGFTLVELLAVIVILAVIALITIPIIGNIIEDSQKKALEQSVYGIVEAARYFTLSNEGIYKFIFTDKVQGKTEEGDYTLDYKGSVNATGELYIDNDGNISLCLMNDTYYVYKNYNSGIYIGDVSTDTCIVGYDAITNKYVAMLDDGTGQVSNVYSKSEVDNLVTNLQEQIAENKNNIDSITSTVDTNTTDIANLETSLGSLNEITDNMKTQLNTIQSKTTNFIKSKSVYAWGTTHLATTENSVSELNVDISKYIDDGYKLLFWHVSTSWTSSHTYNNVTYAPSLGISSGEVVIHVHTSTAVPYVPILTIFQIKA